MFLIGKAPQEWFLGALLRIWRSRDSWFELATQYLSDVTARQRVAKLDILGCFITGEHAAAELDQFRFGQAIVLADDEQFHTSPECSSGTPMAAASMTSGCCIATASISLG